MEIFQLSADEPDGPVLTLKLAKTTMMETNEKTPRRKFFKETLKDAAMLSAGLSISGTLLQSFKNRPEDVPTEIHGITDQQASTEKDFRMGVIGPAELSLVTSQIAVGKATNRFVKEFAGFELTEAEAVTTVLKDLGTPVPEMTDKAKATLAKIKSASGSDFDKAYIQAQIENHEFLRDLAINYLKSAAGKTDPAESQGRHLATLALATFKEHVSITKDIFATLG